MYLSVVHESWQSRGACRMMFCHSAVLPRYWNSHLFEWKSGLTWKERRLKVVGGRLRRRVESVQREQVVCELMRRRWLSRCWSHGVRRSTEARHRASCQLLEDAGAVVERRSWRWRRTKPNRQARRLTRARRCLAARAYTQRRRFINPLDCKVNDRATWNNMTLVHWPLVGGLLHLVQRGGAWAGCGPAHRPLLALPTAHPSYCCITVHCSSVLICPLKG